jgi:hypothetical protein
MRFLDWCRSVAGLLRAEVRGAAPMMVVLCLAGATLLYLARWLLQVTPETLLRNPMQAWWVLAWAGTIPLCAELFGGGGRSLPAGTLRPLAVRSSAVLDAKLLTLALGAIVLWCWVGAVDLLLHTQFARTKLPGDQGDSLRLFLGSAGLALIATGLVAATVRSALAATVVGLMVQGSFGTVLLAPDWASSYEGVPGLASVVRTIVYFAVHPVVLCLAAAAAGWCISLRGAARSDTLKGILGRALGGVAFAGLATTAAWGMTAWDTSRREMVAFDDENAWPLDVIASPDGKQIALTLVKMNWRNGRRVLGGNECSTTAWVIDVEDGAARPVITPGEIARRIPFGSSDTSVGRWMGDSGTLWLRLEGPVPLISRRGEFSIQDQDGLLGVGQGYVGPHSVFHFGTQPFHATLRQFLAKADVDLHEEVKALDLRVLRILGGDRSILFGTTAAQKVLRIDGRSGEILELDFFSADDREQHMFHVDRSGHWVLLRMNDGRPARVVHALTGESTVVPAGWNVHVRTTDIILRDGRLLVERMYGPERKARAHRWGWLTEGVVTPAFEGLGADQLIDLDGDHLLSVGNSDGMIHLLDRTGSVVRVLRQPRQAVED